MFLKYLFNLYTTYSCLKEIVGYNEGDQTRPQKIYIYIYIFCGLDIF